MRRAVIAAGLVGAVLLASLFLLRQRGPVDEGSDDARPADAVSVPTRDVATEGDVAARSDTAPDPTALDLRNASETFRNSTLLFAIRRAGFACGDVVAAHESDEGVWLASCSDVVIYIVRPRGAEQFDVHQVEYRDSVAPVSVPDQFREPLPPGPQPLR